MIILTGKTCSGKNTIANMLKEKHNIERIVTYTTRKPRENEINGKDYFFLTEEKFKMLKDKHFFAEITERETKEGKVYYGSAKSDYRRKYASIILDSEGVKKVKENGVQATVIYLFAPENEILNRLKSRKSNAYENEIRIKQDNANSEEFFKSADFIVNTNASIEEVYRRVSYLIDKKGA